MSEANQEKPRLLLLAFSPVERDARVLRQAKSLAPHFRVTLAGFGKLPQILTDVADLTWFELDTKGNVSPHYTLIRRVAARMSLVHPRFLKVFCHQVPYTRYAWQLAQSACFRVIYCNDVDTLPMGVAARQTNSSAKIVLDLHEYTTREYNEGASWHWERKPFVHATLKHLARHADATVTVVDSFVPLLRKEFRMKKPIVVHNAPELVPLPPRPPSDGKIHLIHHGGCMKLRKLELMIQMMAHTPERFVLHMMLTPTSDPGYPDFLREEAARHAPGRVIFEAPVLPHQIVPEISKYDIGLFLLPPVTFNYEHALPNKFFDFMGAGLAVAIGPSPNMAKLTTEHSMGWVSDDFQPETMGRMLSRLSDEEIADKRDGALRAREKFNAASEMAKLVSLVTKVARSSKETAP